MPSLDLESILKPSLRDNKALTVATKGYLQKYPVIILLFAVSWCPHCRTFTPELAKYIKKHAGVGVVLIPSEDDVDSFETYQRTMPWPTVEFEHGQKISPKLMKMFHLSGFPSAVAVTADGEMITDKVRELVIRDEPIVVIGEEEEEEEEDE